MTHQLYTGGMTHIYVFFYQFVEYMFSLGHAKIKRRNNAAILVSWMGGEGRLVKLWFDRDQS